MGASGVSNFLQNYIAAGERGQQFRAEEAKQNALKMYAPKALAGDRSAVQGLAQAGLVNEAQQFQSQFRQEDEEKIKKEIRDAEMRARPYVGVTTPEELQAVNQMWVAQGVDPATLPKSVGEKDFLLRKVTSIKDQYDQLAAKNKVDGGMFGNSESARAYDYLVKAAKNPAMQNSPEFWAAKSIVTQSKMYFDPETGRPVMQPSNVDPRLIGRGGQPTPTVGIAPTMQPRPAMPPVSQPGMAQDGQGVATRPGETKLERDARIAAEKEANRAKMVSQQSNLVTDEIGQALNIMQADPGFLGMRSATGGVGSMLSGMAERGVPLTADSLAARLNSRLKTIKANVGFDRLQQMRDSSPTGGALGAITEGERRDLQATLGALEVSQNDEDLKYNLTRLNNIVLDIVHGPNGGPGRIPIARPNFGGAPQAAAPAQRAGQDQTVIDAIAAARAAVAQGRNPQGVAQRLREFGIDPAEAGLQ